MSISSNVTEQELTNLRNLAEQQNINELLNKNRILKQTHDIKLAESLSPITKKLEEVNESTEKLAYIVVEKSQTENNVPQPALEHTQPLQPIENNEGVIYDTEVENTLKNMKNNTGFFKTNEDRERGWIWNGYPIKILGATEVEILDNRYDITPCIQNVLVDST